MNDLAVIPQDPTALDLVSDPAATMVALVEQARTMLAQATGMEGLADVIEWKSRAEAIRVYTQQKDMGHEAELSAAEIVRRAERRIGQLIREGQDAGEIRRRGQQDVIFDRHSGSRDHGPGHDLQPPSDFVTTDELAHGIYPMTDGISDEKFEAAIEEGKVEGNLSRANIVRKVKPTTAERIAAAAANNPTEPPRNLPLQERAEQIRTLAGRNFTSPQIADEVGISAQRVRDVARRAGIDIPADAVFGGKFRKVDPNAVMDQVVFAAMPEPIVIARIAFSELDRDLIEGWVSSLSDAIRSLTTIKRNLQKELTRDQ